MGACALLDAEAHQLRIHVPVEAVQVLGDEGDDERGRCRVALLDTEGHPRPGPEIIQIGGLRPRGVIVAGLIEQPLGLLPSPGQALPHRVGGQVAFQAGR